MTNTVTGPNSISLHLRGDDVKTLLESCQALALFVELIEMGVLAYSGQPPRKPDMVNVAMVDVQWAVTGMVSALRKGLQAN